MDIRHIACMATSLAALLALAPPPAAQQAPIVVPANAPFAMRAWDTATGMPQNSAVCVLQRRDGMVWVGTFGGLCRFDGREWTVHDLASKAALPDITHAVARRRKLRRRRPLSAAIVRPSGKHVKGCNFPMLPRELCEDRTSLNEGEDRTAVVTRFSVAPNGERFDEEVVAAVVRNQAKLAYPSVGAWLEGNGPLPPTAARIPGLDTQLRLQDSAAQALRRRRIFRGALEFEDRDAGAEFADGMIVDLRIRPRNRATELIENFMISANGVATRFLRAHGFPSIQRVVRSPKHWKSITELAAEMRYPLPPQPDSSALQKFLAKQRADDPESFVDLSLTVIKLLGRGEYVPVSAGGPRPGHFGLAVRDYAHSTAPNRRFPDLATQRMLKAALDGAREPYDDKQLTAIADHCTDTEIVIDKIERRLRKSAAALMLEGRAGERFDAIVTGASRNAAWVRLRKLPIDGRVVEGEGGLRVGKLVKVELLRTDVEAGFIDFKRR